MGAAQGLQPHFGQAPVQHLALGHQVLDGAGNVFDRYLRIDPVLIEQIDPVGAQTLEHAFHRLFDVVWTADQPRAALAGLRVDVPAEFAGDHDLVAERGDGFAEDALAFMRAIGLGGIKKSDAVVMGRTDDVDHLGAGGDCRLIGAGHVLDAKADAGHFQLTKLASRPWLSG
ncbi:hypothetical protein D3C72_1667640 [compost metagenome]